MDAADRVVKQGRSGNWAVFKTGSDYPESEWFGNKARAVAELNRRGGTRGPSKKESSSEPDILGYPWEYIQALQRGDRMGAEKSLKERRR